MRALVGNYNNNNKKKVIMLSLMQKTMDKVHCLFTYYVFSV